MTRGKLFSLVNGLIALPVGERAANGCPYLWMGLLSAHGAVIWNQ